MSKEKLQLIIALCIMILAITLGSVWAISYFSKVNLHYKFLSTQKDIESSLKIIGVPEDQRLYASYIRNPNTFRDDFITNMNIDENYPTLTVKEYEETYQNRGKNNTINTSVLGDYNFTTKNRVTYFIKDNDQVVYITVDLNGHKSKPNVWGEDLFTFQLLNDGKAYPMGAKFTDFYENKTPLNKELCTKTSFSKYNGVTCANKVVEANQKKESYFNKI